MKALITGALGQDGSYLSEFLLKQGYEVWGLVRGSAPLHDNVVKNVVYVYGDMRDELSLEQVIRKLQPDEIYNLAGQVFVPTSWDNPAETFDVNVGGLARILHVVERACKNAKVYQASSSEMYGNVRSEYLIALNEKSAMNPVSPYATSKYAAHKLVDVYRKKGFFVVSGILFNHESPRRGQEMVTRKITRQIGAWMAGEKGQLRLGNCDAKRDWGFAGDYVVAMYRMLQLPEPEDFVIGTGKAHSVDDFVRTAIEASDLRLDDSIIDVQVNCPEFARQNELWTLVANYSNAESKLKWHPEYSFEELVAMMVKSDAAYYKELANV